MVGRRGLLVALSLVGTTLYVQADGLPSTPSAAHAATPYLDPTFAVDIEYDVFYSHAVNIDGVPIDLTLDLYTPRGDASTKRPVFIFAHPGAFVVGTKAEDSGWGIRLAQRGYVVASINYRLGSTVVTVPVDSAREVREIDDARLDMQTSVRWVRANAASLRIDPDRIAVGGYSAGAVTALGVAVHNDDEPVAEYPGFSSAVCTAVSYAGANDPLVIDAGDAGALFHHGVADPIIPLDLAVQTRDAMIRQGLKVQWYAYTGEGHAFSAAAQNLANARTIQWLYDSVATAMAPCSVAVGRANGLIPSGGIEAAINGLAGRSGVVSIVAVNAASPGYVQALGCGQVPGTSSNLNLDAANQTRSALAIVHFSSEGAACLYSQARAGLVADLQGYFAVGAFDDIADLRILDTRAGPRPAGGAQTEIRGRPNSTAVASVVITETSGPGYVQILACGDQPGRSSSLNADAAGQTRSALVFIRFDGGGRSCVYNQTATHLLVDIQGYMSSTSFDDLEDSRLLDTRAGPRLNAGTQTVISGRASSTAVVSIVATDTSAAGFLQVLACGAAPGASSNLNVDAAAQTIAGLAFVHFDSAGRACIFNQASTHLVVDVQGYMTPGSFDDITDVRLLDSRTG